MEYRTYEVPASVRNGNGLHEWSFVAKVHTQYEGAIRGTGAFGGERRLAYVEPYNQWLHCPESLRERLRTARYVRMYLATPAQFTHGWRPGWLCEKNQNGSRSLEGTPPGLEGLTLRLMAAAVPRRVPVSGWNLRYSQRGPRPVRWCVPAGAVYFFEVVTGEPSILADQGWLHPVSDGKEQNGRFDNGDRPPPSGLRTRALGRLEPKLWRRIVKNTRLILLHALTPLHVGTGQAVGTVDLPIAREKATGFPLVPASALKGVLRDEYRARYGEEKEKRTFGDTDQAGEWVFTDLRLLCLPVRSFFGVFAYVTCPLILERLQRHAHIFDIAGFEEFGVSVSDTQVALPQKSALANGGKVYLEDLNLSAVSSPQAERAAQAIAQKLLPPNEQSLFTERFAVVSNDVFNFLSETATEVVARVRLQDDTKTVVQGGLWYEEAVPAEAIFYGFVGTTSSNTSLEELEMEEPLQIGGDATIGRGLCKVVMTR